MLSFFENMSTEGKVWLGIIILIFLIICGQDAKKAKRAKYQKSKPIYSSPSYVPTYSTKSDHYVSHYYRRDGTYVPGHRRTHTDYDHSNNYSSSGNTNPYTGKAGYK